jgi:hypothetical protein
MGLPSSGSQIVADHRSAASAIRCLAHERDFDAGLAYDGLEVVLR